jgi:hypothetical protein
MGILAHGSIAVVVIHGRVEFGTNEICWGCRRGLLAWCRNWFPEECHKFAGVLRVPRGYADASQCEAMFS